LRRSGVRPLRGGPPTVVRRRPDGSFEELAAPSESRAP
jgi:hypothetical protein